jgi:putative transposase
MARLARVVAPGIPHHIIQRGNRRMKTFFCEADYREYLHLMAQWCNRCMVMIWSCCMMPNHVHLIAVPGTEDGLRKAIGEAHRRYTRHINFQKAWKGHLWQGRFASYPMDQQHLLAAVRYIELNLVRAGLAKKPEDYKWSSAKTYLQGNEDILVTVEPLKSMVKDWQELFKTDLTKKEKEMIESHERTGRPLGDNGFLCRLEKMTNRILTKQKPELKKNN